MIGLIKQSIVGGLLTVALIGGSLAGAAAKASNPAQAGGSGTGYTETTGTTTDDGTIVFVCTYDDRTRELLFCDVTFYPKKANKAAKGGKAKKR